MKSLDPCVHDHPLLGAISSGTVTVAGNSFSLVTATPAHRVAPLIQGFWEVRGDFQAAEDNILPTADVALVVNLGSPQGIASGEDAPFELDDAWLAGPRLSAVRSLSGKGTWVCGVRLTIQGAYLALQTNPTELLDALVELDAVRGKPGRQLGDAVRTAETPSARFSLLGATIEQWAREGASWNSHATFALTSMQASRGLRRVDSLAAELGVSRQYLHRTFRDHVGMSVKSFARLTRFHHATSAIGFRPDVDLSSVAADCGYFDQAHFTRDFVEFAGMTPGRYLTLRWPGDRGFSN